MGNHFDYLDFKGRWGSRAELPREGVLRSESRGIDDIRDEEVLKP